MGNKLIIAGSELLVLTILADPLPPQPRSPFAPDTPAGGAAPGILGSPPTLVIMPGRLAGPICSRISAESVGQSHLFQILPAT
jgi:hypothetical protein